MRCGHISRIFRQGGRARGDMPAQSRNSAVCLPRRGRGRRVRSYSYLSGGGGDEIHTKHSYRAVPLEIPPTLTSGKPWRTVLVLFYPYPYS